MGIINFSKIITIYVRSLLHGNIDPSNANVEDFLLYCSQNSDYPDFVYPLN